MYSYSTSLERPDLRRFPLEPNSSPQVVLGIYDDGPPDSPAGSDGNGDSRQGQFIAALQELEQSYGRSRNGRICRLLALSSNQDVALEGVLQVAADDRSTFSKAMQTVSSSLVHSIGQMSATLPDIIFSNSQPSPTLERSAEEASSQADAGSRTGTPQQVEGSSQTPLRRSVVRIAPGHNVHGNLVLIDRSQGSDAKGATPSS